MWSLQQCRRLWQQQQIQDFRIRLRSSLQKCSSFLLGHCGAIVLMFMFFRVASTSCFSGRSRARCREVSPLPDASGWEWCVSADVSVSHFSPTFEPHQILNLLPLGSLFDTRCLRCHVTFLFDSGFFSLL